MSRRVQIGAHAIGEGAPTYLVAEMSANHGGGLDEAIRIIGAAKRAGADAVKLQTYTPDTMTLDCDEEPFRIGPGTIWGGRSLHELYAEAQTPWEWHPKLFAEAAEVGLGCFSTPFDASAVAFLEGLDVPAYKVASFELTDLPLLEHVGATRRPVILSTGMATFAEIEEALGVLRHSGATEIVLLKCTSAYPATPEEMDLRTIPDMADAFGVPVGLSDHTLGTSVAVAAVALGACMIEKHLTLDRSKPGPDAAFSLEPEEFRAMAEAVRTVELALGRVRYEPTEREAASRAFRRSCFVVRDVKRGEVLSEENVRVLRPADGLAPRYYREALGLRAACDIPRGTPLSWEMVEGRSGSV